MKGICLLVISTAFTVSIAAKSRAEIINLSILTNSGVYSAFGQFETDEGQFISTEGVLYSDHLQFVTFPSNGPYPTADILFRSAADGGGISYVGDSNFDLKGAQIYFDNALPREDYGYQQFGEFGTVDGGSPTYYQVFLTASDPASFFAAPEPTVWALMLMGVGMLGGAQRMRRKRQVGGKSEQAT